MQNSSAQGVQYSNGNAGTYTAGLEEFSAITDQIDFTARWAGRAVQKLKDASGHCASVVAGTGKACDTINAYVFSEMMGDAGKTLVLRDCQLMDLPEELFDFIRIETLDLGENRFADLHSNIVRLTSLATLSLNRNCFQQVPACLYKMPSLKQLDLGCNAGMGDVPEIFYKQMAQLVELNLSNTGQASIKDSIVCMRSMQKLVLSCNPISSLPEAFERLQSLLSLDLSGCEQLQHVPEPVLALKQLKVFSMAHTHIQSLPERIDALICLEALYFGDASITSLPEAIGRLSSLKVLDVRKNRLAMLPASVGQLSKLETLKLADNQLLTLPETLSQLLSLKSITVRRNFFLEYNEAKEPFESYKKRIKRIFQNMPISCNVDWLHDRDTLLMVSQNMGRLIDEVKSEHQGRVQA